MCGITAAFAYRARPASPLREELVRASSRMQCRGPDGDGLWMSEDGRVGLAHRRLAIIDCGPRGAQPMTSGDGSLVISFNGEIYNFRALRAELEAEGCRFVSDSDTEVLLQMYARHGTAMIPRLRGMFAFAIWDKRKQGLLLARDPFGIKPLYYADDGRCVRAASEVKALIAGGGVDTAPDPAGHVGFFLWGHVPEPHTLYRNVHSLPAGSTLWIDSDGVHQTTPAANLTRLLADAESSPHHAAPDEVQAIMRDALLDSIRHHLVADVDVGVFLSSGLDSTTIAALASELGGHLRTVTLGFEEYRGTEGDETPLAESVAARYGTRHQTVWVARDSFRLELDRLVDRMDQPTIDGVNSFFVARATAQAGLKVALSGLGGDELFGGYPSFRHLPQIVSLAGAVPFATPVGRLFRKLSAPALRRFTSPKFAGILEYGGSFGGAYLLRRGLFLPWELREVLDEDVVREGWAALQPQLRLEETVGALTSNRARVSALEASWYLHNQLLRDTDWASMSHSLEVRVPLVDWTLWSRIVPLAAAGSGVDKRAMASTPRLPLPDAIMRRTKTGFTAPTRAWLAQEQTGKDPSRGLRNWAQYVYERSGAAFPAPSHGQRQANAPRWSAPSTVRRIVARRRHPGLRLLVLVTDAYGGRGGIAKFNRDLLESLAVHPACTEIVAIPRVIIDPPGSMPHKLRYRADAAGTKASFVRSVISAAADGAYDGVICGHINLTSLAWFAARRLNIPVLQVLHGIEAWQPPRSRVTRGAVGRSNAVVSVSDFTRRRFLAWANLPPEIAHVIPNCVDAKRFGVGAKSPALLARYGLAGRTVLLTLGRLAGAERYKGFDEVMGILPGLSASNPSLSYLIVGEGQDQARLERKAESLGVRDRVVFAGYVSEDEKADHYRLADAFVMPSRGEGFGIVYLEALACGIPVVASTADASREAVRDGVLGEIVDPDCPADIEAAVLRALGRGRGVPDGLDYFSVEQFQARWHSVIDRVFGA